jgi:hypothetical protein
MAVQLNRRVEKLLSVSSTMNKILVSLLNGTSLQQGMGRDQQMEQDEQ